MARRKKLMKILFGIVIGVIIFQLFNTNNNNNNDQSMCVSNTNNYNDHHQQILITQKQRENNDEKSSPNLLFVGVMTAAKYLDNRARAVYETWGRDIPGTITFYSSEHSHSEHLPLVALSGVDDSYPPQKKSFLMLKHMHDNYLEHYEWFLRADDDVYIKADRLEAILRSVDSTKAWFIGQTGRGNTEEFGLLSLENDENFCMGGPGVIFSRETLRRMVPHVDRCLQGLVTSHEDVELGRCVKRFAGISCTWSYEMQVIFYHNQSGHEAFTGNLKQREVHRAITLHPVKQPQNMYRLHKYVKGLQIENYQQENVDLHRDIAVSMSELGYRRSRLHAAELIKNFPLFIAGRGTKGYLGDSNILGTPQSLNRYRPHKLHDVLEWELISKTLYSHRDLNPRRRIGSSLKEGLQDVTRELMELINSYSKQRGRVIDFNEILYGYWRLDPIHGANLILDLLLVYRKYRGHKMTVQVRRHAYVQQTFTSIFVREVPNQEDNSLIAAGDAATKVPNIYRQNIVNEVLSSFEESFNPIIFNANNNNNNYKKRKDVIINFILPLSGRFDIFSRFLKLYESVCIKEQEAARLIVVLYRNTNEPNDFEKTKSLIETIQVKYRGNLVILVEVEETFTRAKALEYGVKQLKNDNELMLFIDVDMAFNLKSLYRIRRNTIENKSIYFPIVYSLYYPGLSNKSISSFNNPESFNPDSIINEQNGFWRQFGFGIVSLYKSDYIQLGGFNLSISGWGFEDVTFYDNAVKSPNLKIVRSVDPSLVHIYHSVNCDINLDSSQRNMCLGTQASTLGALYQLQQFYKQYEYLFR